MGTIGLLKHAVNVIHFSKDNIMYTFYKAENYFFKLSEISIEDVMNKLYLFTNEIPKIIHRLLL